ANIDGSDETIIEGVLPTETDERVFSLAVDPVSNTLYYASASRIFELPLGEDASPRAVNAVPANIDKFALRSVTEPSIILASRTGKALFNQSIHSSRPSFVTLLEASPTGLAIDESSSHL